ncbi:MAG TPA: toll/interleukin-1 receptor domain-containing protein [Verrucomicrobiae bacterium]|nr:toll/interleukin-1 receptor domain-containing protein [Verrucomicrobiae bacterium]
MTSDPAEQFHAFLSHNSRNKPAVRDLKNGLCQAQLNVWLDEDELRPGVPWQELLEAGIRASHSVVVIVGADGLGPWEDEEMQGALILAVRDKRPVIPVLLPGCPDAPKLPLFLGNRTWVDLRNGVTEDGLARLMWGITGKKPGRRKPEPPPIPVPSPSPEPYPPGPLPAPAPGPQPAPATLNQLLAGNWQVQIQVPYAPGVMGQLSLQIFPNNVFRGTLMSPMGVTQVEGHWQTNPLLNQIGLQGIQTDGYQTIPYAVLVQVTFCNPQQIVGITSMGEQVTWTRTG